jgi:hypothetical protein
VVVVGAGLAYFAFTAVYGPPGVPLTSATPNAGQAATQFNAVGFRLRVDGIDRTGGIVRLQLLFTNTSTQQQRADPQDFRLEGSAAAQRPFFHDGSDCPNWGRVDLYPPGGSDGRLRDPGGTKAGPVWGPSQLCFQDPGGSLTLIWEPDVAFGPLSEPIRIPLR